MYVCKYTSKNKTPPPGFGFCCFNHPNDSLSLPSHKKRPAFFGVTLLQVEYLVPHLISQMQLRKALAEVLGKEGLYTTHPRKVSAGSFKKNTGLDKKYIP